MNDTENINVLRQDMHTVLFFLSPLEVLRCFPVPSSLTILRTSKGEPVNFCGQFFALPPRGHLLQMVTGGHFLGSVFRTFCLPWVSFFTFFISSRSHFKFLSTQ